MLFYSTNHHLPHGFKEKVSFTTALLTGQAPDEGLFMPEFVPQLSENQIKGLRNQPYFKVATEILKAFLQNEIEEETLLELTRQAYTFDVPVEKVRHNPNLYIARMDAGPTASFKDFAAQIMARLMNKLKSENQKITILVATSGDTGSAIGEAFRGLDGINVVILYPKGEVSAIQRKQLTTVGENVKALEISGKFDDCQLYVKKAFSDADLQNLNLTSANSINIGRLLPQVVYYFYMYLKVAADFEEVDICIPTGNLGNAMGCELARQMGLPVRKIIVATNANHAIPEWLKDGKYQKVEPSVNCLSNAMNVGNPSNLARLFDLYGGTLDKNGLQHREPDLVKIREHITGFEVTDAQTIGYVKDFYDKNQILIEPHGAVGLFAAEKLETDNTKTIVLETAHPAKFPEVIEKELGFSPELPESLKKVINREEKKTDLEASYETFKNWLLTNIK
jgi:threonine synthase